MGRMFWCRAWLGAGGRLGGSMEGAGRSGSGRAVGRGSRGRRGGSCGDSWSNVGVTGGAGWWGCGGRFSRHDALGRAGAVADCAYHAHQFILRRRWLNGPAAGSLGLGLALGFGFGFRLGQSEVELDGGDSFGGSARGIEGDLFADQAALQVGHGLPFEWARRGGWLRSVGMIDTRRAR